jgi:hypothetical protein
MPTIGSGSIELNRNHSGSIDRSFHPVLEPSLFIGSTKVNDHRENASDRYSRHYALVTATISAREETLSLRNIRFSACLTEFSVIQSSVPISAFVRPKATSSTICNSRAVRAAVLTGLLRPSSIGVNKHHLDRRDFAHQRQAVNDRAYSPQPPPTDHGQQ